MITGYNTDVEHDGVVYHVQTEDKGLETPLLLSLVYSGGAILASKRSSYQDLIAAGFDEGVLAERLQRQHRLICAAINAGRIGDLKKMSSQSRTGPLPAPPAAEPAPPQNPPAETLRENQFGTGPLAPVAGSFEPLEIERNDAAPRSFEPTPEPPSEPRPAPPVIEPAERPPAAPSRPSAYTVYDSRRRAPQAESPRVEEGLRIFLAGEKAFRGGDTIAMDVCVTQVSGQAETPAAAAVSVKILGTNFRPVILSLKTNRHGVATVSTRIPNFTSGRAAIVIKATTAGESVETRRVIYPG